VLKPRPVSSAALRRQGCLVQCCHEHFREAATPFRRFCERGLLGPSEL
jgi:hypothetical protein